MFGKRLKITRERCGFTQQDIADVAMVSRVTVGRWESGASMPSAPVVWSLAAHLGVSGGYLCGTRSDPGRLHTLTDTEKKLLAGFRALNLVGQDFVLANVIGLKLTSAAAGPVPVKSEEI